MILALISLKKEGIPHNAFFFPVNSILSSIALSASPNWDGASLPHTTNDVINWLWWLVTFILPRVSLSSAREIDGPHSPLPLASYKRQQLFLQSPRQSPWTGSVSTEPWRDRGGSWTIILLRHCKGNVWLTWYITKILWFGFNTKKKLWHFPNIWTNF